MRRISAGMVIPLQVLAAAAAIAVVTLWPPRSGEMLVVPLGAADTNAVARTAIAGGATLIAAGPLGGSLVVNGDRARIRRAFAWNVLILAAPPAGCGAEPVSESLT